MNKQENPTSLAKNQCYQATITNLGPKGAGLTKINNKKIIVPNTLPNEEVSLKLVKLNKNHAFGKLQHIISPSKERIEPPCPVANQCGGCQLQHQTYEGQLKFKQSFVQTEFDKYPNLRHVLVHPTLSSKQPLEYRNKAQFVISHFKTKSESYKQVGLYAANSHRVIDINQCYIQHPIINDILKTVRTWVKTSSIPIYNEVEHEGALRHVVVRVGAVTKEVMVALVSTTTDIDTKGLVETLKKRSQTNALNYTIKSILLNINSQKTDTILGDKSILLDGNDYITDQCGHIKLKLSLKSFYQSNAAQTSILYDYVKNTASLDLKDTVWDLYSGIGSIGLYVANKVNQVIGVEEVKDAVVNATENAVENNIKNTQFIHADVASYIKENTIPKSDVVIVDPPRKGCGEDLINHLINAKPKKIIYVSCNPVSLAKECSRLIENGYDAKAVQPIDMFPQTVHVESVIVLENSGNVEKKTQI